MPSEGRLWEEFRRSLSPRQSGHSTPHATKTVAVMASLPPQAGYRVASVTVLLTFPLVESVLVEDVHLTWIFHQ
ncbi:hypothetical protein FIBSPDRAFT_850295 [Athelia psychrophila]|uniref:Uncharacterized protein n=1 Tax=Athelia psychrophila TaxID=1759441 RepID=A0A166TQF1_9AGAM|nr:hypothetical protein FIBSPDRAFT_850295 [Fibularhizoctonia sp. CBS 109695]